MAKETMPERNSNPEYFEVIECEAEGCKETNGLLRHRFNESYICPTCLNNLLNEVRDQKERELDELYGYTDSFKKDMALSDLITERAL